MRQIIHQAALKNTLSLLPVTQSGCQQSICSCLMSPFLVRSWIFKIHKKIVSLTELMAGVKAPSKTCQLFQLMCWPQGYKVPTSTNALVELMNMVERWRQRTDYGPVVVVSQDGIGRYAANQKILFNWKTLKYFLMNC